MNVVASKIRVLAVSLEFPFSHSGPHQNSRYWEKTILGLARNSSQPLRILSLRKEGQASFEKHHGYEIARVDPPAPFVEGASLQSPSSRKAALGALAEAAASWVEEVHEEGKIPVAWVYGSECAWVASTVRRAGAVVVSILHRLAAEEALLAFREWRSFPVASALSWVTHRRIQDTFLWAASLGAGMAHRLTLPKAVLSWGERISLERRLLRASHRVVAVGHHFARTVEAHYPRAKNKLRVCMPGTEVNDLALTLQPAAMRRVWVQLHATESLGWHMALDAIHTLWNKTPHAAKRLSFQFQVAREETMPAFTQYYLQRLRGLRGVQVLPVDVHGSPGDAVWVPSLYEPSAENVLSLMAQGCVLLTSNADGPRDVYSKQNGYWAQHARLSRNVGRLRRLLTRFANTSDEELSVMKQHAFVTAQKYSWDVCEKRQWELCVEAVQTATPMDPELDATKPSP